MKTFLLYLIIFFVVPCIAIAQPEPDWLKHLGGTANEFFFDAVKTNEGNFAFCGTTSSFGSSSLDFWLVKTTSGGDTLWTKRYGGAGIDVASSVVQTTDNGFLMLGTSDSYGAGGNDLYIVKTNSLGVFQWQKTYGGSGTESAGKIIKVSTGYFVVGTTTSRGAGSEDIWLLHLNSIGDTLWTKTYGGSGSEFGYKIVEDQFGNYIIAGASNSSGGFGNFDALVLKIDVNGNQIYSRRFGGAGDDRFNSIRIDSDGYTVAAGNTASFGAGDFDYYLVKLNSTGDTVWTKTFGYSGTEVLSALLCDSDGGYTMGGHTSSIGNGSNDGLLIKANSDGSKIWEKTIGGIASDRIFGLIQNDPTSLIPFGATDSYGGIGLEAWYFHLKFISLRIGSKNTFPGSLVTVPVRVSFPTGFTASSAQMTFTGFQGKLDFLQLDTAGTMVGSGRWTYVVNETGDLVITAFAGSNDLSGSGIFVKLQFSIIGNTFGLVPVTLQAALFNTGATYTEMSPGSVFIYSPSKGDVDLNGTIQAFDASMILKYLVGQVNLNELQMFNANVTADATVTALDASVILQYVVGLVDTLPVSGTFPAGGVLAMQDRTGRQGTRVDIPIIIAGGSNVLSFDGEITYDPTQLDFHSIVWSSTLTGFDIRTGLQSGVLKIAGAGPVQDGQAGVFAEVRFTIKQTASGPTDVVLHKWRWNEDAIALDMTQARIDIPTGIDDAISGIPKEYALDQNFPNPFNPSTTIQYQLPQSGHVSLKVFNMLGEEVAGLVNEEKNAGYYEVQFNAQMLPSGVYVYRIEAGRFTSVKKLLFVK